jgi:hypothetical protein
LPSPAIRVGISRRYAKGRFAIRGRNPCDHSHRDYFDGIPELSDSLGNLGGKEMRVVGLFVVVTIAIGMAEGLDTPGGVSLWHILLVAIAAFAVERLYSGFVMKERRGIE